MAIKTVHHEHDCLCPSCIEGREAQAQAEEWMSANDYTPARAREVMGHGPTEKEMRDHLAEEAAAAALDQALAMMHPRIETQDVITLLKAYKRMRREIQRLEEKLWEKDLEADL